MFLSTNCEYIKNIFIFIVFTVLISKTEAQQLLPNPGFEDFDSVMNTSAFLMMHAGGKDADMGSASGPMWHYKGFTAWQKYSSAALYASIKNAHSGTHMAAVGIYPYRGFLVSNFCRPLTKNITYNFEMFVSPVAYTRHISSDIGAYFSDTVLKVRFLIQDSLITGKYKPQIVNADTQFIKDKIWYKLSGTYQAHGGEKFLIIGNFNSNNKTKLKKTKDKYEGISFFIDDVSLTPAEKDSPCVPVIYIHPVLNKTIRLSRLYFDFDKYQIKENSYEELDSIAEILVQNPSIKIKIIGHTDSVGNENYNLTLSKRRAHIVAHYLQNYGIAKSRILAKGYGNNQPIDKSKTDTANKINRRVEIMFMR